MRIALDIDDVLYAWSEHAHAACEAAGITNGKQITRWEFWRDYGCTADELWAVINAAYETGDMLSREPLPGTVEQLQRLRDLGHTIHLITARGFEGDLAAFVRAQTAEWVATWEIPHDTLTFAKDKGCIRADVGLDDSVTNCAAMKAAGIDAWLMTTNHNHTMAVPFPRVASVKEFVDAIETSGGGGRAAEQSEPYRVSSAPTGESESRERLDPLAATLSRLLERLRDERDSVGEATHGWHQGACDGLTRAIDMLEEAGA